MSTMQKGRACRAVEFESHAMNALFGTVQPFLTPHGYRAFSGVLFAESFELLLPVRTVGKRQRAPIE
jgi:hypothetical protein